MITYEELNLQNHKITELTNILKLLLGDRILCDADTTHELVFRYMELVGEHLKDTEADVYTVLLSKGDQRARNAANSFMSGSKEIKRIYKDYQKQWCKKGTCELVIKDFSRFQDDTDALFDTILDRIQAETEQLYPLVRRLSGDSSAVS